LDPVSTPFRYYSRGLKVHDLPERLILTTARKEKGNLTATPMRHIVKTTASRIRSTGATSKTISLALTICITIKAFIAFYYPSLGQRFPNQQMTRNATRKRKGNERLVEESKFVVSTNLINCTGSNKLASRWCLDASQTARYIEGDSDNHNNAKTPNNSTKILYKYRSHHGYEKCLANKSIVLIGDSRVRYQYMALASFLKTGSWMKCQDYNKIVQNHTSSQECFLIDHEHHKKMDTSSWNDWYQHSNTALNDDSGRQKELCDCTREKHFKPKKTHENRFLQRQTPYGLIQITYLQNFEDTVKFHDGFPPFDIVGDRYDPGCCSGPPREVFSSIGVVQNISSRLNATHVFVSKGWTTPPDFACALTAARSSNVSSKIKVELITHPALRNQKKHTPPQECDVKVLNRAAMSMHVPGDWFWDQLHVLSILNQEFNHLLLDHICGSLRDA